MRRADRLKSCANIMVEVIHIWLDICLIHGLYTYIYIYIHNIYIVKYGVSMVDMDHICLNMDDIWLIFPNNG